MAHHALALSAKTGHLAGMLVASFALNVVILCAVLALLWRGHAPTVAGFGPDSPSRRIVLCAFGAVWVASATALAWPDKAADVAHTLLPLQIAYALLTWPALGISHPVARGGLALAAFHIATMITVYAA